MKPLSTHARTARVACSSALLIALVACASGQPARQQGNLDLGGGISMTADGQVLGATPVRPSSVADDTNYLPDDKPTRIALPAVAPVGRNEVRVK